MKTVGLPLDPSQFTVVRHVAIVDEFQMTNDDGTFVANVDENFLRKLVDHMNEREVTTGDLCPVVIGHTLDGVPETGQPPVVGYLRNWAVDDFFNTGRKAAFADVWVMNDEVERARKYPRRSAEIWVSRYEADPVSLLGATSPARDLGLLKLSRNGSLTYESPGDMTMPEEKDKKADDKSVKNAESSGTKELCDKLDQVLAAISSLAEKVGGAAPGAEKPESGNDEISDEELEKILGESGGGQMPEPEPDEKSRKGEEPVKNSGYGYPGGNDTHVAKLQRDVAVLSVQNQLGKLKLAGFHQCDPDDMNLVNDLAAMPDDMRGRQIERLKLSRTPGLNSQNVNNALNNAESQLPAAPDGKKVITQTDMPEIMKLARSEGLSFGSAARKLNFHTLAE